MSHRYAGAWPVVLAARVQGSLLRADGADLKHGELTPTMIIFDGHTQGAHDVTTQYERCNQPLSKLKVSIMLIAKLHVIF